MKDIYIVGAGGFGREVLWLIQRINNVNLEWNIKGFIDDNKSIQNTKSVLSVNGIYKAV